MSEFKYLGHVLNGSGTDAAKCCRKVSSERKVVCAFRPLANVRALQLECVRVLHEVSLKPDLLYGSRALTRDLMAPATLLPLATFLLNCASSVPGLYSA